MVQFFGRNPRQVSVHPTYFNICIFPAIELNHFCRERCNIQASLFPPASAPDLHLEHCRRVLPHDQNTGGFFVAVLEKVGDLPWMGTRPKVMKKQPTQPTSGELNLSFCITYLLRSFVSAKSQCHLPDFSICMSIVLYRIICPVFRNCGGTRNIRKDGNIC